ncbi:4Fe-4S dicluster domain-containing protein [Sedimenticola thiotaurini]|uniref:Ferredoxin n=1 Tax=Sedimenticola thiotaurini TaxID=1543721 RepID=A0A0F7K2C5_9GAMM|nr:4Fe-4S dicluster domain-containing protein [Sedimenticola thiotaurini]AKH21694.1 ferredoxin [Sedimenticola thiotaurini]
MAYEIIDSCVNCWACEPLCPSQAISEQRPHFRIDAKKCTECEGDYADPQCVSICPIEGAILNPFGEAANPPGSLTGIQPERMAQVMAEIQAR